MEEDDDKKDIETPTPVKLTFDHCEDNLFSGIDNQYQLNLGIHRISGNSKTLLKAMTEDNICDTIINEAK